MRVGSNQGPAEAPYTPSSHTSSYWPITFHSIFITRVNHSAAGSGGLVASPSTAALLSNRGSSSSQPLSPVCVLCSAIDCACCSLKPVVSTTTVSYQGGAPTVWSPSATRVVAKRYASRIFHPGNGALSFASSGAYTTKFTRSLAIRRL
jgi:hypothetical protein